MPDEPAVVAAWPTCPGCGARRSTRCPVCKTAGSDFRPGDLDFSGALGLSPAQPGQGMCCGPGGCTPVIAAPALPPAAGEVISGESQAEAGRRVLLLCSTCDEPFTPIYAKQCEWCGYEFADGFAAALPTATLEDTLNPRIVLMVFVLGALAVGTAIYFRIIFR